jgi:hypothetical protein
MNVRSIWLKYDIIKYSRLHLIWNKNLLCFINVSFKHYGIDSDVTAIQRGIKVSHTNEANDHYCGNSRKITFMKSKKWFKGVTCSYAIYFFNIFDGYEKIISFDIV